MTNESIKKELKRLSRQMQLDKNPDNILVMEACTEIENLQAMYNGIVQELVQMRQRTNNLIEELTESCNNQVEKVQKIQQDGYVVGYIDCANQIINKLKEVCE